MKNFVELFKQEIQTQLDLSSLFQKIETALNNSERLVGYRVDFDLESLMAVLRDLAIEVDRPASFPTFAFTLSLISEKEKPIEGYSMEIVRNRLGTDAEKLLKYLQSYIFAKCIAPIQKGQEKNIGYSFLDAFYSSLLAPIDRSIFRVNEGESWIFTTNWDLCLKQWLEYIRIPFEDGTQLDAHRKPVLRPSDGWKQNTTVKVVPLHGSYDLLNCTRFFQEKTYNEIQKVVNPEVYFTQNPSETSKAFIVYPLEAVGYDQTIRSPYLDMLILLKKRLETENNIFVIGFSFRDSIIASIFDEVVRKKAEEGREQRMKIMLLDSAPTKVIENLQRQGYKNIANNITPVKITFHSVINYEMRKTEFASEMNTVVSTIRNAMSSARIAYDNSIIRERLEPYGFVP